MEFHTSAKTPVWLDARLIVGLVGLEPTKERPKEKMTEVLLENTVAVEVLGEPETLLDLVMTEIKKREEDETGTTS
jgi:hypothetical protein